MKIFRRMKSAIHRRWKLVTITSIVLLIGLGPYFVSRARSPGRRVQIIELSSVNAADSSQKLDTLRVLTFNIAHGRGPIDDNYEEGGTAKRKRITEIAGLIKNTNADVVILNEIDFISTWSGGQNQAEAIAKQAGFRYRVEQRNYDFRFIYGSWKFGNAILSRYPILNSHVINYPAVAGWEEWLIGKKGGLVCTLQLSESQKVKVVAVHLETRDVVTRLRSAKMLLKIKSQSKEPTILAGDFNSTPPGFPYSEQAPVQHGKMNTIQLLTSQGQFHSSPTKNPQETHFTYSSKTPDRVIDWILIPENWQFKTYRVLNSNLSDHRPVLATLQIPE
jgi:endonuclease/exonuclease/phosphatase family metal-dependent hydrolase